MYIGPVSQSVGWTIWKVRSIGPYLEASLVRGSLQSDSETSGSPSQLMLGPGHPAFTRDGAKDDRRNGFSEFWDNEDEVWEINCCLLLRTNGGLGL